MPEGYGYSPEGIRRYLEDLAKKHGILPPDVPPADNRDIFKSKDTSFVPAHEKYPREVMRQPLAELPFTIDEETGTRVPIGKVNPLQRKTMEPLPSTQRRTLGQQPRTSYISRRKTDPVDSTRGDSFLQPQPPGLQRAPVPAAPQWRPDHTKIRPSELSVYLKGLDAEGLDKTAFPTGLTGAGGVLGMRGLRRRLGRGLESGARGLGGMAGVTEGDIARLQRMAPEGMAGGGMASPTPFSFEQLQSLLSGSDGTNDEMERQRQLDVLRDFNRRSRSMRTGR